MAEIFGFGTKKAIKKVKMAKKGLKPYEFAYGTVWAKSYKAARSELKKELLRRK